MAAQKPMKKPVSKNAAAAVANLLKKGNTAPTKTPVDAEDMIDGGVDEKTEKE